jgi:hypothetical protein
MKKHNMLSLIRLVCAMAVFGSALLPAAVAQETKPKEPAWLHGLELKVRKAGEFDFTANTQKWGVEAYKDDNTGCLIYITEKGTLTVLNPTAALKPTGANEKPKMPVWLHGLEMKVRKAGEAEFTKDTKKFGVEAFRDDNTGCLIYMAESGSIQALTGAESLKTSDKPKEPEWLLALELLVRKYGEENFTKETKKRGLEAFKDPNADTMIYISETGSLAAFKPPIGKPAKIKEAPFVNGLDLQVRKAGETEFKTANKFGLEYYNEDNAGPVLYISLADAGGLSAVKTVAPVRAEPKMKPPKHFHGLELKVRKAGEAEFGKDTKKYGLEVFKDENTNCWVYICETGDFSVVPAK